MMRFSRFFSTQKKIVFFVALCALALYALFMGHKAPMSLYAEEISAFYVLASVQEQFPVPSWAETVMRAFAAAYPDRIGPVEYRNGDWAFLLEGRWFYYATSRILPEGRRNYAAEYRPLIHLSGNYLAELPSWESTAAEREAFTRRMEERRNRPPQTTAQPPRAGEFSHRTTLTA